MVTSRKPLAVNPPGAREQTGMDSVVDALKAIETTLRWTALTEYTYLVIPGFPGSIQGAVRIRKTDGAIEMLQELDGGYHWVPTKMVE
jgi:hypothetical protein